MARTYPVRRAYSREGCKKGGDRDAAHHRDGALTALLSLAGTAPAWAGNPFPGPPAQSGTPVAPGSPNHLCGTASTRGNAGPGNAPNAQSAFNPNGVGGSTYNPRGQYDVACFQAAGH